MIEIEEFEEFKKEIEERLSKLENNLKEVQEVVKGIEEDIYVDLDEELECNGHCSSCSGCEAEE